MLLTVLGWVFTGLLLVLVVTCMGPAAVPYLPGLSETFVRPWVRRCRA